MALDVLEGDLLIVGTHEYPIKSCAEWQTIAMNSQGFRRMASVSASTKRAQMAGAGVNRKKGAPSTLLTGLRCTPLDPVDPELRKRLALETPHELLQTFLSDGSGFVRIVVEDLKK